MSNTLGLPTGRPLHPGEERSAMGHFKSNLRDLEFNLFEVFRVQDRLGTAPFDGVDDDTARGVLTELNALRHRPARGVVRRRRPQPTGVRPGDALGHAAAVAQGQPTGRCGTASGGACACPPSSAATASRPSVQWAASELHPRLEPGRLHVHGRARTSPPSCTATAPSEQQRWAELMIDRGWGATMVLTEPDAGSDVGAGPHEGDHSRPTAPGTSTASSASSPRASTT